MWNLPRRSRSAVVLLSHGCLATVIAYPRHRPLTFGAFVSAVLSIVRSRRRSSRWLAALFVAAWLFVAPRPASATWRNVRDVSRGTAQVLEKGELTFGIFAPIAYGVTDSITVQSSPIFDLLLIPNVGARYRFVRTDRVVLAATLSYKQAFLSDTQPGELDAGGMGTLYINDSWALTGGLLIAQRFSVEKNLGFQGGLALYGAVHMLATPRNLVMLTAYLRGVRGAEPGTLVGIDRPLVTLAWIQQLRVIFNMHLVLSVSYGSFPLRGGPVAELPVWPGVDAWWRY